MGNLTFKPTNLMDKGLTHEQLPPDRIQEAKEEDMTGTLDHESEGDEESEQE